ncbi:MAG: DUF4384 domain-containing protein [Deltaproteobacteria bacterium]|nr:DUF4384 domain-containing protein [Deltaproteobacteria bacterium]
MNRAARVYLLTVDAQGKHELLYPREGDLAEGVLVAAGQQLRVPSRGFLRPVPPVGVEHLRVIASEHRLDEADPALFRSLRTARDAPAGPDTGSCTPVGVFVPPTSAARPPAVTPAAPPTPTPERPTVAHGRARPRTRPQAAAPAAPVTPAAPVSTEVATVPASQPVEGFRPRGLGTRNLQRHLIMDADPEGVAAWALTFRQEP